LAGVRLIDVSGQMKTLLAFRLSDTGIRQNCIMHPIAISAVSGAKLKKVRLFDSC
jgi:hypothetical protein